MSETLQKGIRDSNIFLVLMSKSYLEDAACLSQWAYAATLKKPFFIIRIQGVEIPDEFSTFLDGISYKIKDVDDFNEETMEMITDEIKNFIEIFN